ncbi:MAG TPA: hypothetical protein VM287_05750 [Egibacteraceae bacterium]|nr:hypothetical protein [Egibacteraceae bacterium]
MVVHNNTSRQVNALEVAATGRSGEGTLHASGATDDVAPAIVPPGGRSLGYIFFSDPPAEGLEWTFSVNPGASFGGGFETNLTVTEVNTSGESIVGSVVNDSGGSVRFARVVYVCFGATGQPTTANSVFTSPIDLTSGQPASFSDEHRTACETYLAASAGRRG